ncbi:hypothetical protein TNIN_144111 [Trichonephila inaurata madagascariensis]|uniref:Uncharacterized protein n=1 Tax=Trichonephila inaurata madagascariensis TaxID=2747483 RepID=A0A8X7BV83_9ARAC|nr:hypothetical protein TNIN_144111 [Trichonephila inaurata madagascariensis]
MGKNLIAPPLEHNARTRIGSPKNWASNSPPRSKRLQGQGLDILPSKQKLKFCSRRGTKELAPFWNAQVWEQSGREGELSDGQEQKHLR